MTQLQAAPSTSHFIEANGIKLHYLDYGVAGRPPLLCVHGAAAHAHWFDFVAPGLVPDHHVYALDLRGHGDSAWAEQATYTTPMFAQDLNAVVEQLDLRDFVLIGHSMGGMISLQYAATYPGRATRLIIVDTSMLMPLQRVRAMREFGMTPASSYASRDDLVARYRLNPPETQIAAPAIIRHMAMHSGKQGSDGRWQHKADRRVYAEAQQIAGVPLWANIKIPALVIRGERSTRYRPPEVAEIRAQAPQVQVAEIPASNHHITLDNPLAFIDVVQTFLRTA